MTVMTPRIRRPEAKRLKTREHKDSQLAADYRFWISFRGSCSSNLADASNPFAESSLKRRKSGGESD